MSSRISPPPQTAARTEPYSFSAFSQLESSFHFLEVVRATDTRPITALLVSVPHVRLTKQSNMAALEEAFSRVAQIFIQNFGIKVAQTNLFARWLCFESRFSAEMI